MGCFYLGCFYSSSTTLLIFFYVCSLTFSIINIFILHTIIYYYSNNIQDGIFNYFAHTLPYSSSQSCIFFSIHKSSSYYLFILSSFNIYYSFQHLLHYTINLFLIYRLSLSIILLLCLLFFYIFFTFSLLCVLKHCLQWYMYTICMLYHIYINNKCICNIKN